MDEAFRAGDLKCISTVFTFYFIFYNVSLLAEFVFTNYALTRSPASDNIIQQTCDAKESEMPHSWQI